MRHILLLGAGFSRNWGGFLANEVFDYLFGCPEILGQPELKALLWRHRPHGGFEAALAELQAGCRHGNAPGKQDQLDRLQHALAGMFTDMKTAFATRGTLEFQNDIARMISTFMHRFDAIFSLNQDVLMEMYYLTGDLALSHARRWAGGELPGMRPGPNSQGRSWADLTWRPLPREKFATTLNHQPFFKLHGSANWEDADGKGLMIMGGEKAGAISAAEVLDWYSQEFQDHLMGERTRLMIIGYGFNDAHINEVIGRAADAGHLGIYIVDTRGADVFRKADPRAQIPPPEPLVERLGGHLVGVSARPLTSTFGGDELERNKLMRFFDA
jgi:hypothetical protein